MNLDVYGYCPCGSGKKLKFCCCKDLLHELEKIVRVKDGEQRVAAADLIQRTIQERGPRPALLALQAETSLALEDLERSEQLVGELLAAVPHSPVGLAIRAIVSAAKAELDEAVEQLQETMENIEQAMPQIAFSAMGIVGTALAQEGRILAGRGHLLLQASIANQDDTLPFQALKEIASQRSIPVLMKQEFRYSDCPPDVPWHGEFNAAMKSARRGTWRAACESLESLNQKVPGQPCVWRNVAILQGWLGQDSEAAAAWRQYATLPGVDRDDAIEAEALANLLVQSSSEDLIDVVQLTYQIRETDRFMELLLSDRRYASAEVDLSSLVAEGEPPPKGVFNILDRPLPPSLDGITSYRDLPVTIGEALVFGRQTDREARVELVLSRDGSFDSTRAEILARWEKYVGRLEKEEVVDHRSRLEAALSVRTRFPHDSNVPRLKELAAEQRRDIYLSVWPNVPLNSLGGKSAREAASDPRMHHRVLGAILNLELMVEENASEIPVDFDELRRQLNLPERGATDVRGRRLAEIPLARLGRVDFFQVPDDELLPAYRRLAALGYRTALFRCASALIDRPSLADVINKDEVLQVLVNLAPNTTAALQYVERGIQAAEASGRSPAPWYLRELELRLARFEPPECTRLLRLITSRYSKEPGVGEALYALLVRYGVIHPDGTPVGVPSTAPAETAAEPAAAAAGSTLWTPDSATAKPESKLWLPGSD